MYPEVNHSMFLFARTMAKLYEDANWSQKDLREPLGDIIEHVTKSKLHCFSLDHMKYYEKEICERKQQGHKLSFTDLWGLFIDRMLHHQVLYISIPYSRGFLTFGTSNSGLSYRKASQNSWGAFL